MSQLNITELFFKKTQDDDKPPEMHIRIKKFNGEVVKEIPYTEYKKSNNQYSHY